MEKDAVVSDSHFTIIRLLSLCLIFLITKFRRQQKKIPKATSALFQIYKVHLTHLHMVAHADESLTHVCATSRLAINYASAKLGIIKTLERENARVSGTLLPEFSFETVFEIKKVV